MNPPYKSLLQRAKVTGTKLQETFELIDEHLTLEDWEDLPKRTNFSKPLARVLAAQAIEGRFDLAEISFVAPRAKLELFSLDYAESPSIGTHLPRIIYQLRENSETRHAVMHISTPSGAIPCLSAAQFLIRRNRLESIYTMRSWDLWLGLPYDMFIFRDIGRYLAKELLTSPGPIRVNAGSAHIYKKDMHSIDRYIYNS